MCRLQAAGGTAIAGTAGSDNPAKLRLGCLAIALGGLVVDQVTKAVAIATLDPDKPVILLGGLLRLQLIRNPGAAFSLGGDLTVLFSLIAIGALVATLGWALPRLGHVGWMAAVGMLLAGITGNLTDRLFREPGPFRGHVIDFLQIPWFATFNVADMFITATAILAVWLSMITQVGLAGKAPVGKHVDG